MGWGVTLIKEIWGKNGEIGWGFSKNIPKNKSMSNKWMDKAKI